MTTPFGAFGLPPDAVSKTTLALGLALATWSVHRARRAAPSSLVDDRVVVTALAGLAALLSTGYVSYYLRGGPRIIDATSYYLEARAFAEGHVRMLVPAELPSASFRGRFLLGADDGRSFSVIFPPGYPALLALGFLAGAPMLVGPLLAAALVVVTFGLAKRLFGDGGVARTAAVLSVVCAVLRYHTADTMSHGLAAFLFATALWAALGDTRGAAALAGAAGGWLVATRPVSGALCLALVFAALGSRRARIDRTLWMLLGALPPVVAFLVEQWLATGAWLQSSQGRYYALADAPAGCFRYGFGAGIGCRFEHGDFVRAHLENGFGLVAALGTTLRRLKMHLADAANTELFAPVLVYALARSFCEKKGRLAALGVLGVVAVYAPFYFDGNYPGGGARFFADVLPLEHALIAWAVARLRAAHFVAPVALLGFSLHTAFDHLQLASREGGRPLFEPAVLAKSGVSRGLLFVTTDHGFNLGFDPRSSGRSGVIVARRRRDANDLALWEALGRPEAYEYAFDASGGGASPAVVRIALDEKAERRFEAESEWPPLAVSHGSVEPMFSGCASGGRALWIRPSASGAPAVVRLEAPAGAGPRRRVRVGWVGKGTALDAHFALGRGSASLVSPATDGCAVALGPEVAPNGGGVVELQTRSELGIDFIEFEAVP